MLENIGKLNWDKPQNLMCDGQPLLPTTVINEDGIVLGVVYSSKESLAQAMRTEKGVYYSRTRQEVWVKSPSAVNGQQLLEVKRDCDGDALLFKVRQHGVFCHTGELSCFQETIWTCAPTVVLPLRIGIPIGHAEGPALELLSSLGIHIYKRQLPRAGEYQTKSHLHPNIKVFAIKHSDIFTYLDNGLVDMIVGYVNNDDLWIHDKKNVTLFSNPAVTTQIVASSKSSLEQLTQRGYFTILTEFEEETEQWLILYHKNTLGTVTCDVIPSHGNVEQQVAQGLGDVAVAIYETGNTIEKNELQIVQNLGQLRLCVQYSYETLKKEPRFYRELRNSIETGSIYFYSVDGANGFMSNFYPCQCLDSDLTIWPSSEHFYQAMKFPPGSFRMRIFICPTAKQAYKTSWLLKEHYRKDWETDVVIPSAQPGEYADWKSIAKVKDLVMWKALQMKFANLALIDKLEQTGGAYLVEHALKDAHFGCGLDGTGKNMLGLMLMYGRTHGFHDITDCNHEIFLK